MDKMELRKKALMLGRDKLERKPMDMSRDPMEMMGEDEQESGENEMISMMVSPKEKMVLEQMRKRKKPMAEEESEDMSSESDFA